LVNQVEFSPYLFLEDLLDYCRLTGIQLQAYSPITKGKKFNDKRLLELARKYDKTPAQILLRWNMELGVSAIPKSSNPERLRENFSIFDFTLSPEDVQTLCGFNENYRTVPSPMGML
jgi:methylglyoxal/glyoxal reductase